MRYCAFKSCKNSTKNGHKLCHFPKDLSRRKIWLKNSGLEAVPAKYSTLCGVHFAEDSWEVTKPGERRLKKSAIPTIFTACEPESQNQKLKPQSEPSHREKCDAPVQYTVSILKTNGLKTVTNIVTAYQSTHDNRSSTTENLDHNYAKENVLNKEEMVENNFITESCSSEDVNLSKTSQSVSSDTVLCSASNIISLNQKRMQGSVSKKPSIIDSQYIRTSMTHVFNGSENSVKQNMSLSSLEQVSSQPYVVSNHQSIHEQLAGKAHIEGSTRQLLSDRVPGNISKNMQTQVTIQNNFGVSCSMDTGSSQTSLTGEDKEDKQLQQMIDTNTSLINEVNQRRHNASMQEKDELIEKLTKLLQRNYKVMKAMKTKRKKNTRIREAYVKHLEQKVASSRIRTMKKMRKILDQKESGEY